MSDSEHNYMLKRAAQEKALADEATDEFVRAIHLRLAQEYSMRAHGNYVDHRSSDHAFAATSVGDLSS